MSVRLLSGQEAYRMVFRPVSGTLSFGKVRQNSKARGHARSHEAMNLAESDTTGTRPYSDRIVWRYYSPSRENEPSQSLLDPVYRGLAILRILVTYKVSLLMLRLLV